MKIKAANTDPPTRRMFEPCWGSRLNTPPPSEENSHKDMKIPVRIATAQSTVPTMPF